MAGAHRTAGGLVALGAGAALLLAGCGSTYSRADGPESKEVRRTSVAVDYASYYPPVSDIKRLAQDHAGDRGIRLTFSTDSAGSDAQVRALNTFTSSDSGFGVVVVAPFDPATVEPVAQAAIARGVKVVSYLEPLAHESAGITVDTVGGAKELVDGALRRRPGAAAPPTAANILVVVPPATSPVPDPLAVAGRAASSAILAALRARGITAPATVTAIGEADARTAVGQALEASPAITTILTFSDTTAAGASESLTSGRASASSAGGGDGTIQVSALSPGGVSTAAILRAIQRGGSLTQIIAPRLRDLATALVDVPFAALSGTTPTTPSTVPLQRFTPRAPATQAALADYAG